MIIKTYHAENKRQRGDNEGDLKEADAGATEEAERGRRQRHHDVSEHEEEELVCISSKTCDTTM